MKNRPPMMFKVCSPYAACSFCGHVNIPVVMAINSKSKICESCIALVLSRMSLQRVGAP